MRSSPKDAVALPIQLQALSGNKVTLALCKPQLQLPKEKAGDTTSGVHEKSALEGFVAHFWHVEVTDDKKKANLVLAVHDFPMYHNNKAIKAGAKLLVATASGKRSSGSAPSGPPGKAAKGNGQKGHAYSPRGPMRG